MTALDDTLRARRSRIARRQLAVRLKHIRSLTAEPDRSIEDGPWEPEVSEPINPHFHNEMEEP